MKPNVQLFSLKGIELSCDLNQVKGSGPGRQGRNDGTITVTESNKKTMTEILYVQ